MSDKRRSAVVFVHGLAKKPEPKKHREIWLWALKRDNPMPNVFPAPNEGIDLATEGVPDFFNYYADVFYGEDYETQFDSYYESKLNLELADQGLNRVEPGLVPPEAITPREQMFLLQFENRMQDALEHSRAETRKEVDKEAELTGKEMGLEMAGWLPDAVVQAIIKKAAMEAYYFLFNKEYVRADGKRFAVRQELRGRLLDKLREASDKAEKITIVSHSMGTMVAYDVLRNCPDCPKVDTLITLGSPLGVSEVQNELRAPGAANVDFPAAALDRWINIYDPLDPICGADPRFANDYLPQAGKSVVDIKESNWGAWRHTISHYFAGTKLRAQLALALGIKP